MQNRIRTLWGLLALISIQGLCAVADAAVPHQAPRSEAAAGRAGSPTPSVGRAVQAEPRLQLRQGAFQPVRARRPYKVATSVGYNGLAGIGSQLSYHPNPYVALELGLGFAHRRLPKAGLRLRLNFSSHDFSPFVGLGATQVFGSSKHTMHINVHGKDAALSHEPETMAHLILGVSDSWSNGLTLEAGVGFAKALSGSHHDQNLAHGGTTKAPLAGRNGGPLMEISVGYSF